MIFFQTKRHAEFSESFQVINLTEFDMEVDEKIYTDQIVDCFIRSTHYSYDSLLDCIKAKPNGGYLGQAFNMDKILITDFKKTDKQGVTQFLFDFINEPDWGVDRNEFALLLDWYFEIHKEFGDIECYILSKDWFGEEDERVHDPQSWCYTYYFLIILIDRKSNVLTITEWLYD